MATQLRLFLDRREGAIRGILRERLFGSDGQDVFAGTTGAPVDDLLDVLRGLDFERPALLVYREDGDDRWSYVTLGLNTPELGEGD